MLDILFDILIMVRIILKGEMFQILEKCDNVDSEGLDAINFGIPFLLEEKLRTNGV